MTRIFCTFDKVEDSWFIVLLKLMYLKTYNEKYRNQSLQIRAVMETRLLSWKQKCCYGNMAVAIETELCGDRNVVIET